MPWRIIQCAVVGVVLFGAVIASFAGDPKVKWGKQLIMVELLDTVLDVATLTLTWSTGGFEFGNDPEYLVFKCIITVACLAFALFVVEWLLFGLYENLPRGRVALYFLTIHILFEDGLQLAMYTIVSASSSKGGESVQGLNSIPIYMGMLQGIGFFLYKTQELFKGVYDA